MKQAKKRAPMEILRPGQRNEFWEAVLSIRDSGDPRWKEFSHGFRYSDDATQASVRAHPDIQVAESIFFKHFNYGLEIVSVEKINEKARAA
jgi:hypothetical protein